MKYFTSDFHLSHKAIIHFSNRPFSSMEENNETIVSNIEKTLKAGDELYFLGDLSWQKDVAHSFFERMSRANIRFHWILGNHDHFHSLYRNRCASISTLKDVSVCGVPTVLCHYPMLTWNKSHYNSFMLHGHHHNHGHGSKDLANKALGKILNVNVEFSNYIPWSEEEVFEYMKTRPNNWDLI